MVGMDGQAYRYPPFNDHDSFIAASAAVRQMVEETSRGFRS